jgi:PKD domain-containing protein
MIRRGVALSLVVFVCTAAAARPEAVAIDHKAVGCIVVGKYPKMNACFTPAAELARSRVYFRPEGVQSWYYVDMKSDQPCFTGTLPRPGKKLVGKKIEYYVEAQNKAFEPARTAEFDPIVVKSAQECKKNVPVAPFLNNATVAVFPSVPAGFVGGSIGTAAVVGIVGAGAAAAGTAVAVASNNNDTTTTTPVVVVNSTTTTTTLASTTTTTTLASKNGAPFAVLTTNPDPPSGTGPLTVTFDLCKSTDPDKDPLSFFFDFGDGGKASGSCLESHTYQASFRAADNLRAQDRSYSAEGCVVDPSNASACRSRTVTALTPCNAAAPTITITAPTEGACFTSSAVLVSADAANTNSVNFQATRITFCGKGTPQSDASATVTGSSPYSTTLNLTGGQDCYQLRATATNACTGATASAGPVNFEFRSYCFPFAAQSKGRDLAWSSDLGVEGARLQVVVNGGRSSFPARGRSYGTAASVEGDNRVEAVLVQASGKPGLWRFDLMTTSGVAPGTIRVITGEPVQVSSTSVTFRLQGQVGERVVFTFQKK